MARAALNWSLEEAAEAAGLSRRTVLRFERDHRDIKPELIQAIRAPSRRRESASSPKRLA